MPSDLPTNVGFPNPSIQMTVVILLYFDSLKNWFGEYVQLNFLSLLHDSILRKLVNIICVITNSFAYCNTFAVISEALVKSNYIFLVS
jgi:hypothetical protein